jgi:hypothetical protein
MICSHSQKSRHRPRRFGKGSTEETLARLAAAHRCRAAICENNRCELGRAKPAAAPVITANRVRPYDWQNDGLFALLAPNFIDFGEKSVPNDIG